MNDERRPKAPHEVPTKSPATIVAPTTTGRTHDTRTGLEQAEANADTWWWSGAWKLVEAYAKTGQTFTVDYLQGSLPTPDHPCRYGALMSAAHRKGLIQPVGAVMSIEDSRLLRLWQGAGQ